MTIAERHQLRANITTQENLERAKRSIQVTNLERADLPSWTRCQSLVQRMQFRPCQGVPEAEAAVQKAVQKLTSQLKILPSPEIYPGVAAGEMAACKDPIFPSHFLE